MSTSKSPQNVSFIKVSHPEVFKVKPRAGGFVSIDGGAVETAIEESYNLRENVSKEFRVQTVLEEAESFDSEDATTSTPFKDAMYMLGVTVSTVMMMANGEKPITKDYLNWTKRCLECVKDEFGNHPPNVQGLLNHMKKMNLETDSTAVNEKEAAAEDAPEENADESGPTIRTTTTVKMPESN